MKSDEEFVEFNKPADWIWSYVVADILLFRLDEYLLNPRGHSVYWLFTSRRHSGDVKIRYELFWPFARLRTL